MVYLHNGILFGYKKESNSYTFYSQATALFTPQKPGELFSGESKTEDLWSEKYQVQHIVGSILLEKKEKLMGSLHAPCDS